MFTRTLLLFILAALGPDAYAQTNGIKHYVLTPTGASVISATDNTTCGGFGYCGNGAIGDFDAVVGAAEANDGCNVKSGAGNYLITRANGGVFICRMAAQLDYASGCSAGSNNTTVCSGDPINSTNFANCAITTDGTNSGISECNP